MKTLKKKVLAASVAAASLAGLLAATPAQAYVMAGAVLDMTNFRLLSSSGAILNATTDFTSLTFTGTADQSVDLTGYTSQSISAANPPTNPINFAPMCLGGACPVLADNAFPELVAPPVIGNYSAADQGESGAPIAGLPGFTSPATVGNASYVGIDTGTAIGSADANNNLNSSFIFVLNQTTGMTIAFDLDAFLQVAVSGDEVAPGFATASASMRFTITDTTDPNNILPVFAWTVDIFGNGFDTLSLNAPVGGNAQQTLGLGTTPVSFSRATPLLTAGRQYQASFRMTTEADAGRLAVPEPSVLALMGLGLLGIGATRIRRRYA